MTEFKVGDKVRAIRDTKAPYMPTKLQKGHTATVLRLSGSFAGESWLTIANPHMKGDTISFEAKDFELVSAQPRSSDFNKGDRVTCNSSTSYYATEMVGGEYTVAYATETWDGTPLVALNGGEYLVEPSTLSHVPKAKGFKVGDQVVTSARMCGMGTRLSADAVYTVEDVNNKQGEHMGLRRNGVGTYHAVLFDSVSLYTPKPQGAVNMFDVEATLKAVAKRNNPGWTFRAAPSDFDGPRILRELEAQGAQYAVIVWGKGAHDRIAVISQSFDTRADAYDDAHQGRPTVLYTSLWPVSSFGPGVETTYGGESDVGWHEVTRMDDSPARLKDLKALARRVEAWEQANAKVRVYVAYGASGGASGG